MNKVFLLTFLLAVASAKLAIEVNSYPNDRQDFACFAYNNVSGAILEILDEAGDINIWFLTNYIFMRDANITNLGAIAVVNDAFTPDEFCNNIANALPLNFNGTLWLQVKDFQGLWSLKVDKRLSYLEDLTKTCQQHGLKPGFYTSAIDWAGVLGDQLAGSDILSATPLWYSNTNNIENFDDFSYAGLGTWDKPAMKNFAKNYYICGGYYWGADYYEN